MKGHLRFCKRFEFVRRTLLLVATGWILCGCGHTDEGKADRRHDILTLMNKAETIMDDDPETALLHLDSIESQSIRGRKIQARYALLCSEAMYKNGIEVDSDSLIMVAVRYYTIKKDLLKRYRSFYTLGCIYNDMGRYNDAAQALSEAERLAANVASQYQLGLLNTQLGMIYFNSFIFSRAESYYEKSAHCYELAEKDRHRMYALFDVARCRFELDDFDGCRSIIKEIMDWCSENDEEDLYYNCIENLMACSLYDYDIDDAKNAFEAFKSEYGVPQDDPYLLSLFANYYLILKRYDEALSFIDKAWKCEPQANDSINILYVESMILKETGNASSALDCFEQSITIQNENLRPLLQQSIMATQKDYYHNVSELESMKASRRASAIIIVVLISVLIIATVVLYHLYNKQKLKNEIADSLAIISDLTEKDRTNSQRIIQLDNELKDLSMTNESSNRQLAELKSRMTDLNTAQETHDRQVDELKDKVRELFSNQFTSLDKLYQDMIRYEDVKNIDKAATFLNKVKSYFKEITSKSSQKKLDAIINETYNDLMIRLADPVFGISEGDLTIIRLLLIGYSIKTISSLTKDTPSNVYQRRHRLLRRIQGISEPMAAELRKVLNMNELNTNGGGNF